MIFKTRLQTWKKRSVMDPDLCCP